MHFFGEGTFVRGNNFKRKKCTRVFKQGSRGVIGGGESSRNSRFLKTRGLAIFLSGGWERVKKRIRRCDKEPFYTLRRPLEEHG